MIGIVSGSIVFVVIIIMVVIIVVIIKRRRDRDNVPLIEDNPMYGLGGRSDETEFKDVNPYYDADDNEDPYNEIV